MVIQGPKASVMGLILLILILFTMRSKCILARVTCLVIVVAAVEDRVAVLELAAWD